MKKIKILLVVVILLLGIIAFSGCLSRNIGKEDCPVCGGTGKCDKCDGDGSWWWQRCDKCGGTGRCYNCRGTGKV